MVSARALRGLQARGQRPQGLLRAWLGDLEGQLVQLFLVHRCWSACQWVGLAGGLWEGDYLSDAVAAAQHRDYAVDSEGDAAVGRCAVLQGVEEEAEALLSVRLADPECGEHLPLHVGPVDTDR